MSKSKSSRRSRNRRRIKINKLLCRSLSKALSLAMGAGVASSDIYYCGVRVGQTNPDESRSMWIEIDTAIPAHVGDRVIHGTFEDSERPEVQAYARQILFLVQAVLGELLKDIELRSVNLTVPMPPLHITVRDPGNAWRPATDNEIKILLENARDDIFKEFIRMDLENKKYYRWIGGSEFSDECWALERYAGIRMVFSAHLPKDAANLLLPN